MIGSYVSASAQSTPTPEAERFFRGVLQWAGVEFPVNVSGSPLEVRYTESVSEMLLFAFNHSNEPAVSEVSFIRPADNYTATDMTSRRYVPLTRSGNALTMRLELPPGGVQVYHISPESR